MAQPYDNHADLALSPPGLEFWGSAIFATPGQSVRVITAPSYAPAKDAENLPFWAGALARVLRRPNVQTLADDFRKADSMAQRAQSKFMRTAQIELACSTLATLIGVFFLSPLGDMIAATGDTIVKPAAQLAQYGAILLAFLLGLWGSRAGALDRWRDSRAHAEDLRTEYFRTILDAEEPVRPGEHVSLPWQLDYFVHGLVYPQLDYFKRKTAQHVNAMLSNHRWRWVAAGATAGIVLLFLFNALRTQGVLREYAPQIVLDLILSMTLSETEVTRMFLVLGVVVSTFQTFIMIRSNITMSERNAEKFSMLSARIERAIDQELSAARTAAAAGNRQGVDQFADRIMAILEAETRAWREIRGSLRPPRASRLPFRRKKPVAPFPEPAAAE